MSLPFLVSRVPTRVVLRPLRRVASFWALSTWRALCLKCVTSFPNIAGSDTCCVRTPEACRLFLGSQHVACFVPGSVSLPFLVSRVSTRVVLRPLRRVASFWALSTWRALCLEVCHFNPIFHRFRRVTRPNPEVCHLSQRFSKHVACVQSVAFMRADACDALAHRPTCNHSDTGLIHLAGTWDCWKRAHYSFDGPVYVHYRPANSLKRSYAMRVQCPMCHL